MDHTTCPHHPGKSLTSSCERCGSFHCSACLNLDNVCPDCVQRLLADLPDLQTRSLVARFALGGLGLGYGFIGLTYLGDGDFVTIMRGLISLGVLCCLTIGAISFLMWFHLATRRTAALGGNTQGSPAWAVGSFFVPFVNLVHPYRVARAMLTTAGKPTGVVTFWQLTWILGGIVGAVVITAMSGSATGQLVSNLASAASLAGCVLFIHRVGTLDRAA